MRMRGLLVAKTRLPVHMAAAAATAAAATTATAAATTATATATAAVTVTVIVVIVVAVHAWSGRSGCHVQQPFHHRPFGLVDADAGVVVAELVVAEIVVAVVAVAGVVFAVAVAAAFHGHQSGPVRPVVSERRSSRCGRGRGP